MVNHLTLSLMLGAVVVLMMAIFVNYTERLILQLKEDVDQSFLITGHVINGEIKTVIEGNIYHLYVIIIVIGKFTLYEDKQNKGHAFDNKYLFPLPSEDCLHRSDHGDVNLRLFINLKIKRTTVFYI